MNPAAVIMAVPVGRHENRNLKFLFQALLDQETFGCLDIFKADPAIIVADEFDAIDEFVDILGGDLMSIPSTSAKR